MVHTLREIIGFDIVQDNIEHLITLFQKQNLKMYHQLGECSLGTSLMG